MWGPFSSEKSNGGYLLRMVKESGAWKVDYLVLTSANYTAVTLAGSGPDADYQRFAVTALAGALCDKNGMPKDDRALAIAAGMAPELRSAAGRAVRFGQGPGLQLQPRQIAS